MKLWRIGMRVSAAWCFVAFIACLPMVSNAAFDLSVEKKIHEELKKGYAALDYWDYGLADEIGRETRRLLDEYGVTDVSLEFDWLKYQAYLCFYSGEYKEALKFAERADGLGVEGPETWLQFRERISFLAETWRAAQEEKSEHFRFRYLPGPEQVLVEPGLEALEKSYAILTSELKVKPDYGLVLVEVYPSLKALSYAVGLTEKELKDSGTIAICRYRRLMVTTPRRLFHGYDYLTTLSHEFVHYLIYLRNGPHCPIWLHEGVAKYEEARWKGEKGGTLDPVSRSLLASASRKDEYITFDQMHPTFAKFDSPSKGQLAFAEVVTVVDYLSREGGMENVFDLLDLLNEGAEYREALARLTGKDFEAFWDEWKRYVASKGYKEIPGIEIAELKFSSDEVEAGAEREDVVSEADLSSNEAWKYVRLGDLLRNRNHMSAAATEYERALDILPFQPRIQNKLGLCLILMGNHKAALEPLYKAREIYPHYVTTSVNLGRAYAGRGDTEKAIRYFEESLTINPFDPTPYHYLIKLYENAGNITMRDKTADRLRMISGR